MVDAKLNLTTSVQRLEYVYSIDNQVGPPGKRVDVTLPELTGPVEAFEDRDGLWSRLRYISGRYVAAGKGMSLLSVSPESRLILIRHVLQGGTVDKTKPFSALKPAGVYEVPLVKSHWPRSVSVTLENGLRCEEIGLVASPLLDDHVAGLLEIESTVSGDDTGRLPSAMTKAFQARISEILLQLKGLRDFVSRSLAGVGNFVKGSEPSDLENRVGAAVSHLNAVDYGGTLAEFRQKLSDAAQSLREPIRVHWTTKQLNVELPDSEYVGLEQVIVPISPEPRHRNHADGRIGTTWCLALLAVALFALSWRVNAGFPMSLAEDTAALRKRLQDSSEILVAVLLIFPAVLTTQVDRGPWGFLPGRAGAVARVSVALKLALILPILVAVLIVGAGDPSRVTVALFASAVVLSIASVASYVSAAGLVVRRAHHKLAAQGT